MVDAIISEEYDQGVEDEAEFLLGVAWVYA